jgi:hypothetical protein
MMYHNKVAAAIKVNGKVLREQGDLVTLPFGSEYSVLVKNLNSVRIQIKVSVDGTDTTEGTWLVIQPNSSVELERFIKNGNWDSGNKFKFIERTKGIEDHRGIKVDDGLVRIEYQTEQVEVVESITRKQYYDEYIPIPHWPPPCPPRWPYRWNGTLTKSSAPSASSSVRRVRSQSRGSGQSVTSHSVGQFTSSNTMPSYNSALNEEGITVPGGISHQKFYAADYFKTTGHSEVLVLKLRGQVAGKIVVKAVTVKHKPSCQTCGKTNKAVNRCCSNCGTLLELV